MRWTWSAVRRRLRVRASLAVPDLWPGIVSREAIAPVPWRDPEVSGAVPFAAVVVTIGIIGLLALLVGPWASSRPSAAGGSVDEAPEDGWTSALLPEAIYAQARRSSLTPVELDSSRIRPGRWVYETWDVVDGVELPPSQWDTLTIREGTLSSRPVWILTTAHHRRAGMTSSYVDSLYLEGTGLRTVRHVLGKNVTELHGDSITFTRTGTSRDVSLAGVLPEVRALATTEALRALIPLLPLGAGWSGTVNLMVEEHSGAASSLRQVPVDLRVVGRRYLQVPAGRFECWEVRASVPRSPDSEAKPYEWGTAWADVGGRGLVRFDPTSWAGDSFDTATHLVSVLPQ